MVFLSASFVFGHAAIDCRTVMKLLFIPRLNRQRVFLFRRRGDEGLSKVEPSAGASIFYFRSRQRGIQQ